jgi:hypothetical protein
MREGKMKPRDYRTLASLYEICPAVNKQPKPPDFLGESQRKYQEIPEKPGNTN